MSSSIGIGDVIRAWAALDATTDDQRREIARLLGFDLTVEATPSTPEVRLGMSPVTITPVASPPVVPVATPIGTTIEVDLVPFTDVVVTAPALGDERLPMPTVTASVAPEPVFRDSWARVIASSLASRSSYAGPIDIDRLIDLVASRKPVVRVPRKKRLVSASEIVVVIDTSATIAWFRSDTGPLIARIDGVTRAPVRLIEIEGAPRLVPTTGVRSDSDDGEQDLVAVGPNARVIGISDVGHGSCWARPDRGRATAWIQFARALRSRGGSLAIVSPVPSHRLPEQLPDLAACVYWDRKTRPGVVQRAIKELA